MNGALIAVSRKTAYGRSGHSVVRDSRLIPGNLEPPDPNYSALGGAIFTGFRLVVGSPIQNSVTPTGIEKATFQVNLPWGTSVDMTKSPPNIHPVPKGLIASPVLAVIPCFPGSRKTMKNAAVGSPAKSHSDFAVPDSDTTRS